jgi:hypothetical protein
LSVHCHNDDCCGGGLPAKTMARQLQRGLLVQLYVQQP